jgi:hypothetical protein
MKVFRAFIGFFLLLSLTGCIELGLSLKRPRNPQSVRLSETVVLTSTGAVNMNVPPIVNHNDIRVIIMEGGSK